MKFLVVQKDVMPDFGEGTIKYRLILEAVVDKDDEDKIEDVYFINAGEVVFLGSSMREHDNE